VETNGSCPTLLQGVIIQRDLFFESKYKLYNYITNYDMNTTPSELLDVNGCLVIIDTGNPIGSHTVRAARKFLLDHINKSLSLEVINPRIGNEMSSAYKAYFQKHFDTQFQQKSKADISFLVQWFQQNIQSMSMF
jgi:ribosomal protein RSM22 (predicted rRNA methylase)